MRELPLPLDPRAERRSVHLGVRLTHLGPELALQEAEAAVPDLVSMPEPEGEECLDLEEKTGHPDSCKPLHPLHAAEKPGQPAGSGKPPVPS